MYPVGYSGRRYALFNISGPLFFTSPPLGCSNRHASTQNQRTAGDQIGNQVSRSRSSRRCQSRSARMTGTRLWMLALAKGRRPPCVTMRFSVALGKRITGRDHSAPPYGQETLSNPSTERRRQGGQKQTARLLGLKGRQIPCRRTHGLSPGRGCRRSCSGRGSAWPRTPHHR